MNTEDVAQSQKFLHGMSHFHVFHDLQWSRIKRKNSHAEGHAISRYLGSYSPEPEYPQPLSFELCATKCITIPFTRNRGTGGFRDSSQESEQQRPGVLGGGAYCAQELYFTF